MIAAARRHGDRGDLGVDDVIVWRMREGSPRHVHAAIGATAASPEVIVWRVRE